MNEGLIGKVNSYLGSHNHLGVKYALVIETIQH